jgi:hypothetical protein
VWKSLGKRPTGVDEVALARLRHAIGTEPEDLGEQEQLNGVLRMLGAEITDENQLALFGSRPPPRA